MKNYFMMIKGNDTISNWHIKTKSSHKTASKSRAAGGVMAINGGVAISMYYQY